jgi:hypothetical protein
MSRYLRNNLWGPLALCILMSSVAWANDDGSILKITSPENGQIVGPSVEIKYELTKGTQGDHVHAYVDGEYQKGFKGTLYDLERGNREIVLKVANSDHDVLATSAKIQVEVK